MSVQDFFSIVQLGVGLHLGTAILHLVGEFGVARVERRIENLTTWLRDEREAGNVLTEKEEQLKEIQSSVHIYRLQYANEYRDHAIFMFVVAGLLMMALAVMSYMADWTIDFPTASMLVILSIAPAILSFEQMWRRSTSALNPITRRVGAMEAAINQRRPTRPGTPTR